MICSVCQKEVKNLHSHMLEKHDQDCDLEILPDPANVIRKPPTQPYLTLGTLRVPINQDVDAEAFLPLPYGYRLPMHGELAEDVQASLIALAKRRHTYIWGDAGAGKDAVVHAWSYMTMTPALIFQVQPGVDIQSWFFAHEFSKDGTYWKEGALLTALRDGYVSPISQRRIPYLILITDLDRATSDQMESLRLVMDSISGRVKGPNGVTYQVLPGTQIVATGNTSGGGDVKGKYTSSKVIDSSMMDRFQRVFQFHWMRWEDEELVVKDKFPLLVEREAWVFEQVGKATEALRTAIQAEEIYAEFSHRGVCTWLGMIEDTLELNALNLDLLRTTFRVVADKMPDPETREQAYKIIDPYLKENESPVGKRFR